MTKQKKKRDLHVEITKRFIKALESDRIPWIKPWRSGGPQADVFPVNAVNERRYRGINIPILWSSAIERGYTRDRWLTYRQAVKAGGHVRRGEKGTLAVFYRTIEKIPDDDEETDDTGDTKKYRIARSFTLFNVEQCEGLPDEVMGNAIADPTPCEPFPAVDALVELLGVKIRHGGDIATYYAEADVIQMPPAQQFESPGHYYSTLLHELCHWTGHASRLNRPGITEGSCFNSLSYAFEELIAEIGSAFLCAEYGIKGDLRHEEYVTDWVKLMEDKPRAIFQASAAAQSASDYLISSATELAA